MSASARLRFRSAIVALGVFIAALSGGQPAPAAAQDLVLPYPWCSVRDRLHCDFTTLQQCEETVDYHGFCEANPEYPPHDSAPRRGRAQ